MTDGSILCPRCNEDGVDSGRSMCRRCNVKATQDWRRRNPEKWAAQKARTLANQRNDPTLRDRRRDFNFRKAYGIGLAERDAMWAAQGSVCAACGTAPPADKPKSIHIDHDHRTGRIRGILCQTCNIAVGCLHDDPAKADALARYLRSVQ